MKQLEEERPKKEEQEEKSPPLQLERLIVIQVGKSRIDLLRDNTASTFELVGVLQALLSQLLKTPLQ